MKWIIGIDGGGTKTVGRAVDITGMVLGQVEKGPGNYHNTGLDNFTAVIGEIIDELAISSKCNKTDLLAVSLGLAGADRESDEEIIGNALRDLGLNCCYLINNDAKIALAAGLLKTQGIVLIAGTGSIAYGVNANGEVIRAGGWGHFASDEGSGYYIGRQALLRGIRAAEGRDKATILLDMIMKHQHLKSWDELISYINSPRATKAGIAAFARIVTEAAERQDLVACEILQQAGRELSGLVRSVLNRGFSPGKPVELCLYGGIAANVPLVREQLAANLGNKVEIVIAQDEPVAGAVLLGLAWVRDDSKELS